MSKENRTPAQYEDVLAHADETERKIMFAIHRAHRDIRNRVNLEKLESAIRRKDIDGALAAVGVDHVDWTLRDAIAHIIAARSHGKSLTDRRDPNVSRFVAAADSFNFDADDTDDQSHWTFHGVC